jgi:hypothetical protein
MLYWFCGGDIQFMLLHFLTTIQAGSIHSVAEALLLLLESTAEPIIPYNLHNICLTAASSYLQCKQVSHLLYVILLYVAYLCCCIVPQVPYQVTLVDTSTILKSVTKRWLLIWLLSLAVVKTRLSKQWFRKGSAISLHKEVKCEFVAFCLQTLDW